MHKLFDESLECDTEFNVSNNYAKRYDTWREKEELAKLKAKYGDEKTCSEESSESSEDELAEEITPVLERNFFQTLSKLKGNRPEIYDKNFIFFPNNDKNDESCVNKVKKKKTKPLTLRELERQNVMNGQIFHHDDKTIPDSNKPSYHEEQQAIKDGFKAFLQESDEDEDGTVVRQAFTTAGADFGDTFDGMLVQRHNSCNNHVQKAGINDEFRGWLKGCQAPGLQREFGPEMADLQRVWSDAGIAEDEAFLRDYILERRYLVPGDETGTDGPPSDSECHHSARAHVPTSGHPQPHQPLPLDVDDEPELRAQDLFERKYNFRFQEPDQQFIKQYPRTVQSSMRREDARRRCNRQNRRERLADSRLREAEERKRLSALKQKQLMQKLEKIKQAIGTQQLPFSLDDLQRDFDPDEHEKKMSEAFAPGYQLGDDVEKPVFSDDDSDIYNWDEWENKKKGSDQSGSAQSNGSVIEQDYDEYDEEDGSNLPACEQPGFNMDCDFVADPSTPSTESNRSKRRRKFEREMLTSQKRGAKRRSATRQRLLEEALTRSKPSFDPAVMDLGEYIDTHYRLDRLDDCADTSQVPHAPSHMPFRYRTVVANDFSLDPEEILLADEQDLNRWASLRLVTRYLDDTQEERNVRRYQMKSANVQFRRKMLSSVYVDNAEDTNEDEHMPKKKMHKGHKKRGGRAATVEEDGTAGGVSAPVSTQPSQSEADTRSRPSTCQQQPAVSTQSGTSSRKQSRHTRFAWKNLDAAQRTVVDMSDQRLQAYGLNPKQFRNKARFAKQSRN